MTNDIVEKQALEFNDLSHPNSMRVVEESVESSCGCSLNCPTVMVTDKLGLSYVFHLMQVSRERRLVFLLLV